jgi:hypothetical protein
MPAIPAQLSASDAELRELKAIFGNPTDADFDGILQGLASAALEEYTLAFSGTRAPTTLRELRELRLRLLFEHLPTSPTDTQVAQLMQLTPAAARTLIAGTRARYRTRLEDRLRAAAVQALKGSTPADEANTARVVVPDSLAAYLRDLLSDTRTPPLKKSDTISLTWEIKRSAAEALGEKLGFTVDELGGFTK